jgi:hypothetical protein
MLQQEALNLNASWVSVRVNEEAVQGGFCAPVDGVDVPGKLFSLAAMLADSREHPWLGIFKIEEGIWWYVAVRDGYAILPDGDVIGDWDEIEAARERHTGFGDWNFIEGDLSDLAKFVSEINAKPTRVRALVGEKKKSTKSVVVTSAVALAVIIAGGAGTWWYIKAQKAEELAAAAAMAKMRATLVANTKAAAVKPAVAEGPNPDEWLRACRSTVYPIGLSRFGWSLTNVACSGDQASVEWKAGDGASVAQKPDGTVLDDGRKIAEVIALNAPKASSSSDSVELGEAKRAARAWAQQWGFTLTFVDMAPPTLPGAAPAAAPAPPTKAGIILEMATTPFKQEFSVLPGLRLTKINTTDSGWHLEGVIYGR